MKTVTLWVVMIGFLVAMARPSEGCLFKNHKDKDHSTQAKAVKVQGHPVGPTSSGAVRPSAFGGERGTLWTLAGTVHNQ